MSEQVKNANISGKAAQNLSSVPGGPSIAAISGLNEQVQAAQGGNNYAVVEGANQGSNEFPYQPFAQDSYDTIAQMKNVMRGGQPMKVVFDKDDAEYMLRQRAQVENADYDRWVMQKYDLTDPAQNFLMQQIAPDQFQRRLDLIDYQQSLVSKYARIRLLGAKSSDDLRFEWMVETGRIQLPEGPIWDPEKWMTNQYIRDIPAVGPNPPPDIKSRINRRRFMKGLFNPLNYPDDDQTGWQRNYNNPADIRGSPIDPTVGQLFTGSRRLTAPYERYGENPVRGSASHVQENDVAGVAYGTGYIPGHRGVGRRGWNAATEAAYLAQDKGYGVGTSAPWRP